MEMEQRNSTVENAGKFLKGVFFEMKEVTAGLYTDGNGLGREQETQKYTEKRGEFLGP